MDDLGQFLFLAAGAVGLFAYLSVAHWVNARTEERQARDRIALLRRMAEQTPAAVASVLDHLREENARAEEKEQKKELQARRNGMQTGAILIALGVGFAMAFALVSRREPVWILGVIPTLVGLVVFVFAMFNRPAAPSRSARPETESAASAIRSDSRM
jgi:hypothetical protein